MSLITIGHTSDLHGFLYPTNYYEFTVKNMGILSLADKLKSCDLVIDSGDLIQGSALTTFQYKNNLCNNNAVIDAMNYIGYDVHTIGNHEFNYGKEYLVNSFKSFNGDIIVANMSAVDGLNISPYKIYEVAGVKIAVIGLVTQVIPFFEKPEHIEGVLFFDPVECYGKYEQEMLEKSDLIIVNYHGGFEYDINNPNPTVVDTTKENQGVELLTKYDSINVLLTGHQHQVLCQEFKNTLVVQPGYAGEYASIITIDTTTLAVSGELYHNPGVVSDDLAKRYLELEEQVQAFLNQPIYELPYDLKITDHFEARKSSCPYINLVQMVQLDAAKAEISTTSIFDSATGLPKDVTLREIIANYPFSNTLKVLKLHKNDIIAALEVCASYFEISDNKLIVSDKFTKPKKQHYQYDLFYGFDYEFDISKSVGNRVTYTNLEDRYYNVVLSNYRASNFGWYPMYEKKEVINEVATDMQDLIVSYLNDNELTNEKLEKKNICIKF